MDQEKLKELFEEKYQEKLGVPYHEWLETAPDTEDEAYARCQYIDDELRDTHDEWYEGTGEDKEKLEEYRDRLKIEYDLIEEMFGLELKDR